MTAMRFYMLVILLVATSNTFAAGRIAVSFEFIQNGKVVERGLSYVSRDPHTWSKGLQRSYLRLRCVQQISGKMKKLFATSNHFHGYRVTHQLVGTEVKLTAEHSIVSARLKEIRALSKTECKELLPLINSTKESYMIPANNGVDVTHAFGKGGSFRAKLQIIDEDAE